MQGVALTKIPKIKFVIIIAGGKFGGPDLGTPKLATNAFSSPIECPSLHFIGALDRHREGGNVLVESFVNPVVIHYPEGHTIPRLDEKQVEIVLGFIENIQTLKSLGT
ncbi:Serine hydrolase FSH [Parasponia andersonii]|uniref:Serine hydrolase FSH n=1 Tax=Parasponia andersonii TaxID=3476 RepID=A0A2P5ADE3_PARAD|nr:Serine hydrolase FSH [Parasponia andersonii]